jgi:LysM repeat protein
MAGPISNLDDLIALLEGAVQGAPGSQYIVLDQKLLAAAGDLVDYLALAAVQINEVTGQPLIQPNKPAGYVAIVGSADLFPAPDPAVAYALTVTGRVDTSGGSPVVTFDAHATPADAAQWSFAANFNTLPKFLGSKEGEPGLVEQDSFFDDLGLTHPAFTIATYTGGAYPKGLAFTADLDPTAGTLGRHVGKYLQQTIALKGAITQRAGTFAMIDLSGQTGYQVTQVADVELLLSTHDAATDDAPASTADLVGKVTIGSFPAFSIAGPVLQGDQTWVLTLAIDDPKKYTLANGLGALVQFVGGTPLSLPEGIDAFASMYLASVTVGISPGTGASLDMLGASIKYEKDWPLPLPGGKIRDVEILWEIADPFGSPFLAGSISGKFTIEGQGGNSITLAAQADISGTAGAILSSVVISAELAQPANTSASIDAVVEHFTGLNPALNVDVTALSLEIDTGERTLLFYGAIGTDLPIVLPILRMTGASFGVQVTPNRVTGSLGAGFEFGNLPLAVSADYRGSGAGWLLLGGVPPGTTTPTLGQWLESVDSQRFTGVPQAIRNIQLRGLQLSYDTSLKKFDFDTIVGWNYQLGSYNFDLEAEFQLTAVSKSPQNEYSGKLRGTIHVNALAVSVIYTFDVVGNKTVTFAIAYNNATLTAVLSKNKKAEQILTIAIGNVSFGDIVSYLVDLADSGSGFRLSAPWDVLYDISFNNLSLVINLTTRTVGISYRVGLNLGIAEIDTIALTYANKAGTKTVDIAISGKFADQQYPESDPLSWDLLNDPPPAPPGKGTQLLDLRYLGFGQNIAFRDPRSFQSVLDVITALEADFKPVDPNGGNPLGQLPAIRFAGNGNWLIGADFTLMETVSLAGVFNDPVLYGVRIALAGEKSGKLAGLAFEILYKKVSDDIGVYLIKLKVPDAMRQIELGQVSITLPNISLEIYTNGNFRVDVGFPVGSDFSGSFSLQVFPFVGFGGFYFALLNGQTSRTVPKITNGDFSPVIEFGIGLSVGVGKSIDKGVLKAGITLTVTGILEGTVAWFNPYDSSIPSDRFLRVIGTVAIVGKMFGEVDFVIIQARVSVTAMASATMILESYQPTQVELELRVEVSASLKVLFVTIHFSFELTLDLSFTIGQASTPPWIVASGGEVEQPRLLLAQRSLHRPRRVTAAQLLAELRAESGEQVRFDWSNPRAATDEPEEIDIIVVPSVTVAESEKLAALAGTGTTGNALQIVIPLYIPNSISPDATSADEVQNVGSGGQDAPFNKLLSAVLDWTIAAIKTDAASPVFGAAAADDVSIAHLEEIAKFLADPANRREAFSYANIVNLLERNFILRLSSPLGPTGPAHYAAALTGAAPGEASVSTTIFPMIPALTMAPDGQQDIDFSIYHPVSNDYIAALEAYFNQLTNDPTRDTASGQGPAGLGGRAARAPAADAPGSMATVIFESYFAMLAAGITREAISLMNAYPYRATGNETLAQLAEAFGGLGFELTVNDGETLERVAGRYGVHLAAIRRANDWAAALASGHKLRAGTTVNLPVGVSVETIAAANAEYPLARGITLGIENVRYQLRAGDSLESVAERFGIADVRSIFQPSTTGPRGASGISPSPNATNPDILAPNAIIWLAPQAGPTGATFGPTFPYRVDAGDLIGPTGTVARRVAARYTVRNQTDLAWPFNAWYRQRLSDLNPDLVWDDLKPGMTLTSVTAPVAGITGGVIEDRGVTTVYPIKPGDNIDLLAAYLALEQIGADVPEIDAVHRYYEEFLSLIRPQSGIVIGQDIALPGFNQRVQPGSSLEILAERFGAQVPNDRLAAQGLAWANRSSSALLRPLGVLALPPLAYRSATGGDPSTLAGIAQHYNITLDELATALTDTPGIFQPYGASAHGPTMTIPDVASRNVDQLRDDLIAFGKSNRVAAMVSRFLMHGLRVARPTGPQGGWGATSGTELWGLYEMIGQQIAAPASLTAGYEVIVAKGATADWIRFATSPLGPSGAGPTGGLATLGLNFTAGYFSEAAPSPTFSPQILRGPTGVPLYDEMPSHYGLQRSLHWQASVAVSLPGPTGASGPIAGEPTIWPFSDALIGRIARELNARGATAQTRPYELAAARPGGAAATLDRYAWASAVPIKIRRQIADSRPMSNSYLLLGADETGRDALLQAWTYLSTSAGPLDRLHLLHAPDPSMGNPSGLASAKVDPAQTFILKSNLSTVTHSGVQGLALRSAATLDYVAPLAMPGRFLQMLWEASITASGGFYLNYATADGQGLPANLFANGDEAEVWLVLLLGDQAASRPVRTLRAFNNCVVLGENVASTGANLWVRLNPIFATPADLVRVANVPAGSIAFELSRRDPTPGMAGASGPLNPQQQLDLTRSLYSLLGYNVAGNSFFAASNEAVPISPMPPGPTGASGQWIYRQTVPVSKVGLANAMPASPALPDPSDNPYRGITGPQGKSGPASRAMLDFRFHDVFGNQTQSTEPLPPLELTVGYTDPLIGVGGWPGAAFDYVFRTDQGGPVLDAALSLQTSSYVPGAGLSYAQASGNAAGDSERYRQITYQVQQGDVGFGLSSNLGQVALAGDALKAPMIAFVTKAKLFTDATAKLSQVQVETQAGQSLGEFAQTHSTTVEALVETNATILAQRLFAGAVVMPKVIAAPAMNSLRRLIENQTSSGTKIDCLLRGKAAGGARRVRGLRAAPVAQLRRANSALSAPAIDAGPPLTVEELAENNKTAPLNPGLILRTKPRTWQLKPALSPEQRSAAAVAASLGCPVYAVVRNPDYPANPDAPQTLAVGLVRDNFQDKILAAGITLTMKAQGKTIEFQTGPEIASFERAYSTFFMAFDTLSIPITEGDFAVAIADTSGLFAEQTKGVYASFIVPPAARPGQTAAKPGFSLADLTDAGSIADLAKWNQAAPGFFATSVPVYINYSCLIPSDADTLAALAEQSRVSPAMWAKFNLGSTLKGQVTLDIPMLTYWKAADLARSYAGFSPGPQSSLSAIAGLFGLTGPTGAAAIAAINRAIPGIFSDGAVVAGVTAAPLDSLQSVWAGLTGRFSTFDGFVSAIAGQTGIYREKGVIAAPLPTVPGPQSPCWDDLAKAYHVGDEATRSGAQQLVAANRSLSGLLRAGATIAPPKGATGLLPAAVGAFDTVETVLQRFNAQLAAISPGTTVALADVVAANAATPDLTRAGSNFLLPPSLTRLVSAFHPVIPPSGATAPQDQFIFPCLVNMQITRNPGLVAPEFQGATAVFEASTALVARGVAEQADTLQLDQFAESFEQAFANERLKAAISKRHGLAADAADKAHVWAVNFGPRGVSNLAVAADLPQFYALAPLSTESQAGTIIVRDYVSGQGLGATASKQFEGIDLDAWMQQLLEAIDVYLSPAYAVPSAWQTGPALAPMRNGQSQAGPVGFANAPAAAAAVGPAVTEALLPFAASLTAGQGVQDFDAIVSAKADIAKLLRGKVSAILNVAGATAGPSVESAREALYQQMLTTLSSAYTVDAIVQYPVGVTSRFSPTGPLLPPRLSGKVVPDLPQVSAADPNIEAIATMASVSAPFVAVLLVDARGIWRTGAQVTYPSPGGATMTVGSNDTLRSIAAHFKVPTDPSAPGYSWQQWSQFIDSRTGGIGGQPLLNPVVALPIITIHRTVNRGDTLTLMADYVGIDIGSFAEAIERDKGIFAPGWKVSLGSKSYQTAGTESLANIAAALSGPSPVTVRAIAEHAEASGPMATGPLRSMPILTAGKVLHSAQMYPEVTLSTAKVPLAPQSGAPPQLTFFMNTEHEARHKKLFLNLKYEINELEFDIRNVAQAEDYRASSWLSFILPIGSGRETTLVADTTIEQVQIPLPLRSFAAPPLLVGQSAATTDPQATTIPKARQWDYRFDFETRSADQDTNHVEVTFNRQQDGNGRAIAGSTTAQLFAALARFVHVWPDLKQDLAQLPGLAFRSQSGTAAIAVHTLRQLVEGVSGALARPSADVLGIQWPEETYAYRMQTALDATEQSLRDVTFIPEAPLGMTAMIGPVVWPSAVFVKSPTAPTGGSGPDGGFVQLDGKEGFYTYPPGITAGRPITQRLLFRERDVIRNKNAWSGVYVARNENLIANGPLGPRGMTGPVATRPEFIYRTPIVRFVDPLTPFVVNRNPIDVSGLTGPWGPAGRRALSVHLTNMIDAILELWPWSQTKAESLLQLLVNYAFAAAGGASGQDVLLASTPIRLAPTRSIDAVTRDALVAELAANLERWYRTGGPTGAAGYLSFEASTFTGDAAPGLTGSAQKPILRLEQLVLPIDKIDWSQN